MPQRHSAPWDGGRRWVCKSMAVVDATSAKMICSMMVRSGWMGVVMSLL